jgi:hypothetical protein
MVLSLKTWESRSLQGLPKTHNLSTNPKHKSPVSHDGAFVFFIC